MLPIEIWMKIFCELDELNILKVSIINKKYKEIITDNSFWNLKHKNYIFAKFSVFDSIREFTNICNKIKHMKNFSYLIKLHTNNKINIQNNYDKKIHFQKIFRCIYIYEQYTYCLLIGGVKHDSYTYLIILYNINTNTFFKIYEGNYDFFSKKPLGSYVIYGNYVWCSEQWPITSHKIYGELQIYNILTEDKYIIKNMENEYFFVKKNGILYLSRDKYF